MGPTASAVSAPIAMPVAASKVTPPTSAAGSIETAFDFLSLDQPISGHRPPYQQPQPHQHSSLLVQSHIQHSAMNSFSPVAAFPPSSAHNHNHNQVQAPQQQQYPATNSSSGHNTAAITAAAKALMNTTQSPVKPTQTYQQSHQADHGDMQESYMQYFSAVYQSHNINFDEAAPPPLVVAATSSNGTGTPVGMTSGGSGKKGRTNVLSRGNSIHEMQPSPLHWSFDHSNGPVCPPHGGDSGHTSYSSPSQHYSNSQKSVASTAAVTALSEMSPRAPQQSVSAAWDLYPGSNPNGHNGHHRHSSQQQAGANQVDYFADMPTVPPPPPPPVPSFPPDSM